MTKTLESRAISSSIALLIASRTVNSEVAMLLLMVFELLTTSLTFFLIANMWMDGFRREEGEVEITSL